MKVQSTGTTGGHEHGGAGCARVGLALWAAGAAHRLLLASPPRVLPASQLPYTPATKPSAQEITPLLIGA